MISRCYNEGDPQFHLYGARGIGVDDEWRDDPEKFYIDMGDCPEGFSIDRSDNDGSYSKENCRWATSEQQSQNTRRTRLSGSLVKKMRSEYVKGNTIASIWRDLAPNADYTTVKQAVRGITWKNI